MNTPSIKTLMGAFPDLTRKTAQAVKWAMIEDQPAPRSWYTEGTKPARQMAAINGLLAGFGVEYVQTAADTVYAPRGFDYVNMGDCYTATVIWDYATGRFSVATVGDMIERNPQPAPIRLTWRPQT